MSPKVKDNTVAAIHAANLPAQPAQFAQFESAVRETAERLALENYLAQLEGDLRGGGCTFGWLVERLQQDGAWDVARKLMIMSTTKLKIANKQPEFPGVALPEVMDSAPPKAVKRPGPKGPTSVGVDARNEILQAIATAPHKTAAIHSIVQYTGLRYNTVYNYCSQLVTAGWLSRKQASKQPFAAMYTLLRKPPYSHS